tara:strand:+ start:272 stop:2011 length:1740 start_codon:yes stop_codon:yes gene_type:complete
MSKFEINLEKVTMFDISMSFNINNINNYNNPDYTPLKISNLSYYYPTLEIFNINDFKKDENISLSTKHQIINYNTVFNKELSVNEEKKIFFKFSPLLDPTRYMIGKYSDLKEKISILPNLENKENCIQKYKSFYNASYTDNFACFLISKLNHQHNFLHGIDYYGSFLSIQNKYRIDVVDEIDYLFESDYFRDNINKLFYLDTQEQLEFLNYGSRSNKPKINISSTAHNITVSSLKSVKLDDCNISNEELIYQNNKIKNNDDDDDDDDDNDDDNDDDDDDDNDDDNSIENISDDDTNEEDEDEEDGSEEDGSEQDGSEEDEDDDSEEDEKPLYCYIYDFPVQVICSEKCDGTFDELLANDDVDEDSARSILFQIIMILITYQKCFHMTHNDLHTNNIMYVNTDIQYLYYKYNKKCYKVPTYGKIIKIIDYGRSIYKYNNNLFCSDSYSPGGDAHTQYNTEPFFNENKPRLDPNYSFDLCRLGCSIYDFIIDYDDSYNDLDEFQKVIYDWCNDDNKKNILYKKNGDERYPNFKLYKMIARTVHNHIPEDQLKRKYFKIYESNIKKINNNTLFDIDNLPVYV